ncbi:hypothetical protein WA026_021038 [Henosepilachna vigintioctopunctata]|uniref:Uncharacterized protein n=1 Tax=Henosepilachna vigintioctopunctata TaxID=420089 RepID=A0AAW1V2E5_9CUCU
MRLDSQDWTMNQPAKTSNNCPKHHLWVFTQIENDIAQNTEHSSVVCKSPSPISGTSAVTTPPQILLTPETILPIPKAPAKKLIAIEEKECP